MKFYNLFSASKFFFLVTLLTFTSCGSSSSLSPSSPPPNVESLELYLSRASFTGAEFEQFKFSNGRLFAECGKVAGGRQAAQYQDFHKLSAEQNQAINKRAQEALQFALNHELKLDDPGKSQSMFDPGQYNLHITSSAGPTNIQTSLDAIVAASKTSEENLRLLAKELREVAMQYSPSSKLCGNVSFYDLK